MRIDSRMGTTSSLLSIAVAGFSAIFVLLARTGLIGHDLGADTKNAVVRIWITASFLVAFISFVLGIASLFRKGKRKKHAIIGSSLAAVIMAAIATFLPLYYKHHYGYYGIENIFFAKVEAPAHSRKAHTDAKDAYLRAGKRGMCREKPAQLREQVNKIYASYGYPFPDPALRSRFYGPGSRYQEDPSFSQDKIPVDQRAYIDYLLRVEDWKRRLAQKRAEGLLDYEKIEENRQETFEGLGGLLAVDRQRSVSFMLDNVHLLVLQYPDFIPIGQVELPASIANASEFSAVLSPDGRYLALRYFYTTDLDLKCVIILIDAIRPSILHELSAGFGENRSLAQFSRDSKLLYTTAGAYDVASGKKIKEWAYPTDHRSQDIDQHLTMYNGLLQDGSFLAGCWFLHRIYRVDPKVGVYTVFLDLEKDVQVMPHAAMNRDGTMLAGGVSKVKLVGNELKSVRSDFMIWQVLSDNTLRQIYNEEVTKERSFSSWTWGKGNTLFKTTVDKRNYYKLWRYEIGESTAALTSIPIEGLFGGQNHISVNSNFVVTYGPRLWDIETGRKVAPWYEMLDPFDDSNLLPLYEKQPRTVHLRDFWE